MDLMSAVFYIIAIGIAILAVERTMKVFFEKEEHISQLLLYHIFYYGIHYSFKRGGQCFYIWGF
jgi:hypothetical protein